MAARRARRPSRKEGRPLSRPTTEDLVQAANDLEELAYRHCPRHDPRNHTGFPDLVTLLNLLVWVDAEKKAAKEAAAYGPGSEGGFRAIHNHGGGDIDARTRDLLHKQLSNLSSGWLVDLGNMVDRWRQAAESTVGREGLRAG